MPKFSQLTTVGLAVEAAYGTGLAPTKFFPAKTHDYRPNVQRIPDEGKRGVNAKDFGAYLGHQWAELSYGGDFFPDVPPYFLYGILGSKAVTGTGPYTHTFTLGATVPSFTIYDSYVAIQRQMPGAMVEEFTLRWGTTETTAIAWEAKLRSNLGAAVSSATVTMGTTSPWLGWQSALTVGGTGNTKLLNGELTFRRPIEQIWGANNSQDPNQFAAGPLEVTGRVNVYMDDDTDLARFTGGTKPATALTFTSGTNVLTITMSTCDWEAVTIDRSGVYVRSDFNLRGLHNTTDGGPVKVTVANSVANYN
jgi:hypothetical protein